MGNFDVLVALGDALDGGGDQGKRQCDRAGDDHHADADHDQRQAAETGQQEGHGAADLVLAGDLLAAFGIDLGKRFEILVEGGTDGAIGVVVAPFAARSGIDLDPAADQFLAEFDELLDAFLENGELLGVVGWTMDSQSLTTPRILSLNLRSPAPYFFTSAGSVDMYTPRDSITTA